MSGKMFFIAIIIAAAPAQETRAAEQRVIETDWAGLKQRLAGPASEGKTFRVVLMDGRDFKAALLRVESDGIVFRPGPVTSHWKVSDSEAKVPRTTVVSLRQQGRRRLRGRLIGTLAGAGLWAAAVVSPGKYYEGADEKRYTRGYAAAVGSIFVPLGYLIGWALDKPYPELRPAP